MTRSERDKIEAEREARRAKRLSERAEQRARRKADQAKRAAERAEALAERARRRSPRHRSLDRSIEDVVDDYAEKWSRKAEDWVNQQTRKLDEHSRKMFDDDLGMGTGSKDNYGMGTGDEQYDTGHDDDYGLDDGLDDGYGYEDDHDDYDRSRRSSARRAKRRERIKRRKARLREEAGLMRERRRFKRRNRNGNLYRNTQNKKIFGVCSGIADYWGMQAWQVRMMAVVALFVIPSIVIPGYFIASFLMDDKPYYRRVTDRFHELDEDLPEEAMTDSHSPKRPRRSQQAPRQPGVPNPQVLQTAKNKFADIEHRLRRMESHVTSSKFELQRELKKIAGDEA